ncbi:recombinational DNA repair protein (RecF pathway) [Pseudoglutamicibacter cumminsii]|nr:recombinational DNA repair protein (RecF pathway) [Pseudoglutamicibacter cumminsii]
MVTEELVCANCHRQVTVARTSRAKRKYCCHPCYIQHRFNTRGGKR